MKKILLTLAIIFIGLFAATAQSSTTLKISLYPIQIIEFDSNEDNLHNKNENIGFNTFSTSEFYVNILKKGSIEYNSAMKTNINTAYYDNQLQNNRVYHPHIVYSIEVL